MIIEKEVIINKNIDLAWKVLGTDFTHIDNWASSVAHSQGVGESFHGASCTERGCSTVMGGLRERLTNFSNQNHTLSYVIFDGLPSMIKFAENSWSLHDSGIETTKLKMKMDLKLGGFMGFIMKPMLKMKMSKMGDHLAEEFKFYVEQGNPHPRKIKALNKVEGRK